MKFKPPNGSSSVAATIQAARAAESSGRLAEAQALCRQVLNRQPHNVDATLLLADIEAGSGRYSAADQLLRSILERDPNCVEALVQLADLLRTNRHYDEAMALCGRAIAVKPNDAHAYYVLGVCLIDCWMTSEAIEELHRAIEIRPTFGPAYERLGYALSVEGQLEQSIAAFRKAIEYSPYLMPSYVHLGKILSQLGRDSEAVETLEGAKKVAADSAAHWLMLGYAFQSVGDSQQAEQSIVRSIQLAPNAEIPQIQLSQILQESGQFDEARRLIGATIARFPSSFRSYRDLAFSGKVTASDEGLISSMQKLLKQSGLSPEARYQLHFALGKAYDDLGEYSEAMAHFEAGNHLGQGTSTSIREAHSAFIDSLIATFSPDFFEEMKGSGSDSAEPTLVVGMIRTGTTLIDQMLSNHPDVAAVGELSYLPNVARQLASKPGNLTPGNVNELADRYLRLIRSLSNGEAKVIDKIPDNYLNAGLMHLAFRNGRIIHCRRNPIDTCLSIYVTPISMAFAHSMSDIVFAYREYERLMKHWRKVLPSDRFFESEYEELVASPEPLLRRMIEFIGLPWDESVLQYQSNSNAPLMPSRWQVRQPLYKTSVERWRNYERWIGEFTTAFPDATQKRASAV